MAFTRLMNTHYITHRLAALVVTTTLVAETHAQTSQLVYSQNFNSAANDTTGTGLGDGSNMVDNVSNFQTKVWDSSSWGALPAGEAWRALWLTPMDQGVQSNFFMPVKNAGQSVSSFNANFSLLSNYIGYTGGTTLGDGFSINFGKFNNTTNAIGGYLGMYTPAGGTTGNVLTLSFYTYADGCANLFL